MSDKRVQYYVCRARLIPARRYVDVWRVAWRIYKEIKAKTKRRPYVRSAYFNKAKIFFDYFWPHLKVKHHFDRRLRFFECSIELIQETKIKPGLEIENKYNQEKLHRFFGKAEGELFAVQIKEDLKRKQRFLISIFPLQK